jgi:hypothetical protein
MCSPQNSDDRMWRCIFSSALAWQETKSLDCMPGLLLRRGSCTLDLLRTVFSQLNLQFGINVASTACGLADCQPWRYVSTIFAHWCSNDGFLLEVLILIVSPVTNPSLWLLSHYCRLHKKSSRGFLLPRFCVRTLRCHGNSEYVTATRLVLFSTYIYPSTSTIRTSAPSTVTLANEFVRFHISHHRLQWCLGLLQRVACGILPIRLNAQWRWTSLAASFRACCSAMSCLPQSTSTSTYTDNGSDLNL